MMPSGSEWRQPYTLSNFDLVTQSFTLIAGKRSSPLSAIWMRRWTPVVVSSETPTMRSTMRVKRVLSFLIEPAIVARTHLNSALVVDAGSRRDVLGEGLLVLEALVEEEGRITTVVDDLVHALAVRPGERLVGAPPVLLERLALPGEDVRGARADDAGGGVVRVEKMLHDTQRTSAPSASSVSMSTPVWMVMWSEPMMRTPRGCAGRTPCAPT